MGTRQQANFQNLRANENLRPPRVWSAQGLATARDATARAGLPRVAALLDDVRRNQTSPVRYQPVSQAERQKYAQQAQDVEHFRQQRQSLETNAAGGHAKVTLPRSPITATPATQLSRNYAPPKTYVAPIPDPKVAAKPRVNPTPVQPQTHTANRVPIDQPRTPEQPRREPEVRQLDREPQRQPEAKQPAQQPKGNPPAGSKAEQIKEKDKK